MATPTLSLIPDKTGYSATPAPGTVVVILDSPAARYREQRPGSPHRVTVQWALNPNDYAYLRLFYRRITEGGSLPFYVTLAVESHETSQHLARFVPGSLRLTGLRGLEHTCTAELEAVPLAHGAAEIAYDEALIALLPGA